LLLPSVAPIGSLVASTFGLSLVAFAILSLALSSTVTREGYLNQIMLYVQLYAPLSSKSNSILLWEDRPPK
jgi:hypothetical protein